jgi:hypothetical protein
MKSKAKKKRKLTTVYKKVGFYIRFCYILRFTGGSKCKKKKKNLSEEAGIRLGIMRRPVRLLGAKKNALIIIVPNPPF